MAIKKLLKSIFLQLRIYNLVRYSNFYYWVLKYKNPVYIKVLKDDLDFYRNALGNNLGMVFDVGANNGDKTYVFKQIASRVVCIEPDRTAFAVLRTRYKQERSISLENIALGSQQGQAEMYIVDNGSAYNTLNEKQKNWLLSNLQQNDLNSYTVEVSTLDNLILKYGIPDFVKIDVEGYELQVFKGLSYPISIVSFEANLPRFRQETLYIIEHCGNKDSTKFNLRPADSNSFYFPSHVSYNEISKILSSDQEVTYDVFVFQ